VLPRPIETPQPEVVIGRLPCWELVREQAPDAASPYHIVNGIQDLANRVQSRSANSPRWRQERVQTSELGVRQVGQVGLPQGQTPAILPAKPTRVPVFRQSLALFAMVGAFVLRTQGRQELSERNFMG
jgi:hypothetical protein